jgi:hypothetical protein
VSSAVPAQPLADEEPMMLEGRGRISPRIAAGLIAVAVGLLMSVVCGTVLVNARSPTPVATTLPGVTHERMATRGSDGGAGRIELMRTTLAPGAVMPPTRLAGEWLIRVAEGILTVTLVDGSADVIDVDLADGGSVVEGRSTLVGSDQELVTSPDAVMAWENRGSQPVSLLSVATIPGDDPPMTVVDPDAPVTAGISGPVIERRVLRGRSVAGGRYRITIADRSGRLIGARVPSERELRFAGPGQRSGDDPDLSIGPLAWLEGDRSELLIRWAGTPCGPIATVDIAQDLSLIGFVDDTPGCDAMGVPYALVLRFRGALAALPVVSSG